MRSIELLLRKRPRAPIASRIRKLVNRVLDELGQGDAQLHILLTNDSEIREINSTHRGKDESTDVLSFPDGDQLPDGQLFLGQIVISLETARRQAAELGHGEIRELEELIIHGLLHLLGWDHTVDEGEMDSIELKLRRECLE